MPASLISEWKRIAQSGPTMDGRVIKPEWLTDMAETYDPKVYTAKLWIDHMRYSSYGSVHALKTAEKGDTTQLFAKICPTRSLLQMNQIWEEKLHFSIEPTEDFAKTGKCYLTGLAMTDSPASLGTDEMRFSKISGRTYMGRYPGEAVPDLRIMDDDQEVERFGQKLVRWFSSMNDKQEEEPMNEEQFNKFKESLEATQQAVSSLAEIVTKFMSGQPAVVVSEDKTNEATSSDDENYTELKTILGGLTQKFDTILARLEQPAGGTQFSDTTQAANDKDELF